MLRLALGYSHGILEHKVWGQRPKLKSWLSHLLTTYMHGGKLLFPCQCKGVNGIDFAMLP